MTQLPPRTTYYDEPNDDGYYQILPACNNVHKFNVPEDGFVKFNIVNTEPNTQDMSMRGWFSESIMGQMLFYDVDGRLIPFNVPKMYTFDNLNIPTPGLLVYIYDKDSTKFTEETHRLSYKNDYYVCIQNIQNKMNSYRILFSNQDLKDPGDNQLTNGSGFSCDTQDSNISSCSSSNCKCTCHTVNFNNPNKTNCPSCGCLPTKFIR